MAKFSGGETFTDTSPGKSVTHTRLNNHIGNAEALPGLITEQTDVSTAIADDDTFLLGDTSAAGLKKVLAQNLIAPGAITAKTDISTAIAAADLLLMADASDSNALKKVQAQNILPPEAITGKTDLTATVAQDDIVLISDTSASGALKRTNVSGLVPSGGHLQSVADSELAASTTTSSIPIDDTIPTSGEGTEILSLAITPTSATSILEAECEVPYGCNTAGTIQVGTLLRDGTCVAASWCALGINMGVGVVRLVYRVAAGSTSLTTFTVRFGTSGGTVTFNGQAGSRNFGGVMGARLIVRELKA